MTIVLGILCKEGVVLGTDSSATFVSGQERTIEQPADKLKIIGGKVILAGTGQVGLNQRFCAVVEEAWNKNQFQGTGLEVGKKLAALGINDFVSTQAPKGAYGALVVFPVHDRAYLCELQEADFQPELKASPIWFCAMGSGQKIADPLLALMREVFWPKESPSLSDGIFAATWTLDHVIAVNAGGVNGPARLAILQKEKGKLAARELLADELGEHRQNIEEAKQRLRDFRRQTGEVASDVPDVPRA